MTLFDAAFPYSTRLLAPLPLPPSPPPPWTLPDQTAMTTRKNDFWLPARTPAYLDRETGRTRSDISCCAQVRRNDVRGSAQRKARCTRASDAPAAKIHVAEESLTRAKPDLIVDSGDLPATARELCGLLAYSGRFFDRGVPVKVVDHASGAAPMALPLTPTRIVVEAHDVCRPVQHTGDAR